MLDPAPVLDIAEQFPSRIADFVSQRDELVLVVRCSDADAHLVVKLLETWGESRTSELYVAVDDAFGDADTFVDACERAFLARHKVRRTAREGGSRPGRKTLPGAGGDAAGLAPVERLKQLIVGSRAFGSTFDGCAVVWALLPERIQDASAYAQFMTSLWRHEFPFPWCHRVRIVIRDDTSSPALKSHVDTAPRVSQCLAASSVHASETGFHDVAPSGRGASRSGRAGSPESGSPPGRYDRAVQQCEVMHHYAALSEGGTRKLRR